jgi:hypothetical protein
VPGNFLQRRHPCRGADDTHDLLRRLVLGDVSGRASSERKIADTRVKGKEDDLGRRHVVAEHPSDL